MSLGPRVKLRLLFAFSLIASQAFPRDRFVDYHLSADPAHALYQNSAFAHGHRHGYEQGYHDADLDYQFGHPQRTFKRMRNVPAITGYHESFGSRETFREGYEYGYTAGYADGYVGRDFRIVIPADLAQSGGEFDSGLAAGFRHAMADPNQSAECKQESVRSTRAAFCAGFDAGVAMAVAQRKGSDMVDVAASGAQH